MSTINLVITVIRFLEYEHGNFYDVRRYLDRSFCNLDYSSSAFEIRKAIDSIDDKFFEIDMQNKELIKEKINVYVSDILSR